MSLWMKMAYPGAAVRVLTLKRAIPGEDDFEVGDVRIQQWDDTKSVRVGTFLPGVYVQNPGDTGKTEPEQNEWCSSSYKADEVFDRYVQEAYAAGWQNYA